MNPALPHEVLVVEPNDDLRELIAALLRDFSNSNAACVASLAEARAQLEAGPEPCVAFIQVEARGEAFLAAAGSFQLTSRFNAPIVILSYGRAVENGPGVISLASSGALQRLLREVQERCRTPGHAPYAPLVRPTS